MGKPPLTIRKMQEIAKSRGGRCLSRIYEGTFVKLHWECSEKHTWWASSENVKRRTWCPTCSGNTVFFRRGCAMKKHSLSHESLKAPLNISYAVVCWTTGLPIRSASLKPLLSSLHGSMCLFCAYVLRV